MKTISDGDRIHRIGQLLVKGMYLLKAAEACGATAATTSVQTDLPARENEVLCDDGLNGVATNPNRHHPLGSQEAGKEW